MNLAPILSVIQDRTGLDPSTLGTHTVKQVLAERLRSLGLEPLAYARQLTIDAVEFSRLIAEVVVPETWFFRGGKVFDHLAERIRAETMGRTTPFRILSLPCSTGEEPYSLAIALHELGVPTARWNIDGIDLSPRAIEYARRGIYGEMSFRQTTPDLRRRYFQPVKQGEEILPRIRALVQFRVGNLLDPALLLWERPFDLAFCRNLFIYFTPEARKRGTDALARLVVPGGLLVLGHAESFGREETRFERIDPREFFLSRRLKEPSS